MKKLKPEIFHLKHNATGVSDALSFSCSIAGLVIRYQMLPALVVVFIDVIVTTILEYCS